MKFVVLLAATTVISMSKGKVLLGMSGGVDSSVAALLLKEQGYDILGVTLILTQNDDGTNSQDAKKVARLLGFPHIDVDLKDEFSQNVTDYFVSEYKSGRTPNPCVVCNKKIKFGKMLEIAKENGCDYLATGHYAKVYKNDKTGLFSLVKAKSYDKDQTYFLYTLTQDVLSKVLMPLGDYEKHEVRSLAEKSGLLVAKKRDSQDICFIPDGDKNAYLKQFLPEREGNFIDTDGNILGKHKGIFHYTVGQRKGLGMGFGKPMFVLSINPKNNTITLGEAGNEFSDRFHIENCNFIPFYEPPESFSCLCKVRYSAKEVPCTLVKSDNGYDVLLNEQARAITPGQAAVFYVEDELIGGGTIV